ncbi:MAG: hypothetical protein HQ517_07190 [SAR324 cluster bacterium]|nr:hypothetical protein [SAR324 cluster bacterium]
MTNLLTQAFERVSTLSERDQNLIADAILNRLNELLDELKWDSAFSASQDELAKLAAQAERDIEAGKEQPLEDLLTN